MMESSQTLCQLQSEFKVNILQFKYYALTCFLVAIAVLFIIFSIFRGVLQTLVEKHFPAPDRNRILRLLGLSPPRKDKKSKKGEDDDDEAAGSSGKRKPGNAKF